MKETDETQAPIQTYSTKQLEKLYKVGPKTFRKWRQPFVKELKKLGWQPGSQLYTVAQVKLLFEKLGRP